MSRPRATSWVLVVLVALLAQACASAPPQERFAGAFRATLEDSFAFEVLLEADQSALADLGEMAGGAAALLSGIRLRGVVDGADTQFALEALGGTVVELRQVGSPSDDGSVTWLRAGIVDLLASVGVEQTDAEVAVLGRLEGAGASTAVLDAVTRAFDGEWIGVRGGVGRLLDGAGAPGGAGSSGVGSVPDVFGRDLEGFLERYVVVTELDGGILHLDLRLGDLLRAVAGLGAELEVGRPVVPSELDDDLDGLPVLVPGDVRVADGVVEEMAFDVAAAARGLGTAVDGKVVVRIRITEHGVAGPVTAPAAWQPLDGESLDEVVASLLAGLGVG